MSSVNTIEFIEAIPYHFNDHFYMSIFHKPPPGKKRHHELSELRSAAVISLSICIVRNDETSQLQPKSEVGMTTLSTASVRQYGKKARLLWGRVGIRKLPAALDKKAFISEWRI